MKYVFTIMLGVCTVLIPFSAYGQQETKAAEVQITEPSVPDETYVTADERDWKAELHTAAHRCFDGGDFRVDLSGGMAARTLGDQVQLTVPLYSRRERQKRRLEKAAALEHAAGIIGELRAAQAKIRVKREKAAVLKSVLLQGGLSGIEAHFRTKEDIVSLEAVIEAAEMKLSGLVDSCMGG